MRNMQEYEPRELIRGLMRGDRMELKSGWPMDGAVDATVRAKAIELGSPEHGELHDYAEGFAAGMADDPIGERSAPAFMDGFADGLLEPRTTFMPARGPVTP